MAPVLVHILTRVCSSWSYRRRCPVMMEYKAFPCCPFWSLLLHDFSVCWKFRHFMCDYGGTNICQCKLFAHVTTEEPRFGKLILDTFSRSHTDLDSEIGQWKCQIFPLILWGSFLLSGFQTICILNYSHRLTLNSVSREGNGGQTCFVELIQSCLKT